MLCAQRVVAHFQPAVYDRGQPEVGRYVELSVTQYEAIVTVGILSLFGGYVHAELRHSCLGFVTLQRGVGADVVQLHFGGVVA